MLDAARVKSESVVILWGGGGGGGGGAGWAGWAEGLSKYGASAFLGTLSLRGGLSIQLDSNKHHSFENLLHECHKSSETLYRK